MVPTTLSRRYAPAASVAASVAESGDKHCDTTTMHSPTAFHTDAQRGRDVRYAHTIINAHHVS